MLPSVACDSRERKFYSDVSFVLFPMTMREQLANLPDAAPAQEAAVSAGETNDAGTLADDESLAALREKLSGNV